MSGASAVLKSRLIVDLLRARVSADGGFVTMLQRGEDHGGAVLLALRDRAGETTILEKNVDFNGNMRWLHVDPPIAAPANWTADYLQKRIAGDRDAWVVELDIAHAARFAAEIAPIG